MKNFGKALIFLFIFCLFYSLDSKIIQAQTILLPGSYNFTLQSINLTGEGVYLSGNTTYIAAYVQAYYPDFSYRKIGMDCYLNGDETNAIQNCSAQFYPERGVCSISSPAYKALNTINEMKCKIYDPENKEIVYEYVNKTFIPIRFSMWISDYSSIVGEEFNFPVNIKNSGLFTDTYNVTARILNGFALINPTTQSFLVNLHGDAFDPHSWNQTGPGIEQVYIKIIILDASSNVQLCVNITSMINTTISQQECRYLKAEFKSLHESSLIQILFTILMATIFIFKFKKKF